MGGSDRQRVQHASPAGVHRHPARGARPGVAATCLMAVLALAACSADHDYAEAVRANTVAGYEAFLKAHPGGAHGQDVRLRLKRLDDDRAWEAARAANTADAYREYLSAHSAGSHARDALVAMAKLNLDAGATASGTDDAVTPAGLPAPAPTADPVPAAAPAPATAAVAPPAARSPEPPASPAPDAPAAGAAGKLQGYRVQLGAYGNGSHAAESAWKRLSAAHSELSGREPLIAAALSANGMQIYRLQVGGFTRESATALCEALNASQTACIVEPPLGARRR